MDKPELVRGIHAVYLSDLWDFLEIWITKVSSVPNENYAEKMIFLWVAVNAWASKSVPDLSKNHIDAYLVQCMSVDPALNDRFNTLYRNSNVFMTKVDELYQLVPVFQSIWLNNNCIDEWEMKRDRMFFLRDVFNKDPFVDSEGGSRKAMFSPPCAKKHFEKNEEIPVDWSHVLSVIYQIRCNLFHGGKSYTRETDQKFMQLAYEILWEVWKCEIPSDCHYQ